MHFTLYALDVPDSAGLRARHVQAHKAYLDQAPLRILVSGPLLEDDNETINGSFFLLEAQDKAQVLAFNREDPFTQAGIWKSVEIRHFAKWRDNR